MGTNSHHLNCGSELPSDFDSDEGSSTDSYDDFDRDEGSSTDSYDDEVNTPDEDGNVPLHIAVIKDDLEMLKDLLKHSNINVDYLNSSDETPLLMSLRQSRSEAFITHLLTAGCDPNILRNDGRSPLLVAMRQNSTGIAHQLIKKGANVNVLDQINRSPMDFALDYSNFEGVCMLLYYGADVNVSYQHPAALRDLAIFVHIVEALADDNWKIADSRPLLQSVKCDDSKLFKLIWSKIDYEILLNRYESFLDYFLQRVCFSATEFLECLYLILSSPKAFELLKELIKCSSFQVLLDSFDRLRIKTSDRITVINICLSFGFKTDSDDISRVFELYQFGVELEAFIYSFNVDAFCLNNLESPLLGFILGLKEVSPIETSNLLREIRTKFEENQSTFNIFKYFSMPSYEKLRWRDSNNPCVREKYKQLISVPEFPSLLELSRNKSYAFTLDTWNITRPYQFHDAVKNLKLPPEVQDILRFKKPIYY